MTLPAETMTKIQSLSQDRMNIVINLVDQLAAASPLDIFDALCEDGARNPMSEDEVEEFISDVRADRHAVSG